MPDGNNDVKGFSLPVANDDVEPNQGLISVREIAESFRKIQADSSILQVVQQMKELQTAALPTVSVITQALRGFETNSIGDQIMKVAEEYKALTRQMVGPFDELIRNASNVGSALSDQMDLIRSTVSEFESRFHLPAMAEASRMIAALQPRVSLSDIAKQFVEDKSSLKMAVESMRAPWVSIQSAIGSMESFVELQSIGRALKSMPAFDESLAEAMRVNLGDWRDQITWPDKIFTDLAARSEFYVGLGFNPELTDFPAPAFKQSLEIAGLYEEPPPPPGRYAYAPPRAESHEQEMGFRRTNVAHDWLQRAESHVRRFIDRLMTEKYGKDWVKQRLPNGLHDQWQEKKRDAMNAGCNEQPLIAYADFTDYERIICRRDNWREVFEPFFRRMENVRESFQRLHPVRLDTMHARIITQEDELLLRAEVIRLVRATAL